MRLKLHWQILIALVLAVVAGLVAGDEGRFLGVRAYAVFDFVGTLFLNALKMIIVPLVVSSIIVGISGAGEQGGFGRLGIKTLAYYLATSTLAILVGLLLVNLLQPGIVDGAPAQESLGLASEEVAGEIASKVEGKDATDVVDVFKRMLPPNIVEAAADNGQLLGVIVFALLFGFFMTRLVSPRGDALRQFWQDVFDVMMMITNFVMKFAPIGVFALVAKVVADTGFEVFQSVALFAITVILALAVHVFIVMPLILGLVGRVNPLRHYRAMAPALLTAFSTASSSATLPLTMDCVEKNAGVSNRVSSFVLPLGATVNMDGTALYECVAVIFIAQAFGVDLSLTQQLLIVVLALLTSIGVAGVPSASLVAIVVILSVFGIPLEAIGLIYAVDRVLDMLRTSVNVFGDSCGAVVIARSEGETEILKA
ncbi:MAG: dicarboxylate/amino acid:cation symporter [Chromatiales bacterium]|nr:dicarboxylate/amino acid:cation symporter [Chromatiales bacterium]